jgi:UDP-N-acetylmuramoylalanine--D-glutamate ligase
VVLELSSWQLADAKNHKISPTVAIITNIFEDHLNRYANYEEYVNDKRLIFKFQKPKDYLFLNYNESNLREIAKETKSKVYFYSPNGDNLLEHNLPLLSQEPRLGAYLRGQKIYFGANQEEICSLKNIKMMGRHVMNNVLAAISVAKLYDIKNSDIKIALHNFPGLEGRLQFIAQKGMIKFYNDTTATTPESAIAAIGALADNFKDIKNRLVIIAGGADKALNFKSLAKNVCDKCQIIILLKGTATDKIKKEINLYLKNNLKISLDIKEADSMEKAVELAFKKAGKNGLVLLSPGCASFGLFQHEFERGDKFNQAVKELK